MVTVTNDHDRQFTAVLIRDGEPGHFYPGKEPIVVIYDATYAGDARFSEHGQKVSEYFLSTFCDTTTGIALYGAVPEWTLSAANVQEIGAAMTTESQEPA